MSSGPPSLSQSLLLLKVLLGAEGKGKAKGKGGRERKERRKERERGKRREGGTKI